jgi:hypothetical protein
MHDIANKFVDGRHGTFFSGELAGELAGELLLASFFSSQWLERADNVLNVKGTVKCKSESCIFIDEQCIFIQWTKVPVWGGNPPTRPFGVESGNCN